MDARKVRPVTSLQDALPVLVELARRGAGDDAHEVYLVGGWVRDTLLGRPTNEVDLAAQDPVTFAQHAAAALGTRVVVLGGEHPLHRIPLDGGQIDVTPLHGMLEEDLARRDFTVNAMAVPLGALDGASGLQAGTSVSAAALTPHLIDRHNGRADLGARVLRATGPEVFTEDPIRALRAARLSSELEFDVAQETLELISSALPALRDAAPERVTAELLRLFAADRSIRGVHVMESTGLLELCFPELAEGYDMEQRPSHAYDVYRHQVVAFDHLDALLGPVEPGEPAYAALWRQFWRSTEWPETRWGPLRDVLNEHRAGIRIATLLHDIGKPRTLVVQEDGRTRFFGHSELGAAMAAERLRAWRFPNTIIERVALLIDQHLRPGQVMSPGEPPTERALHRFHEALGDATPDVCMLFLADALATEPAMVRERWPAYVRHVHRIVEWRPPAQASEVRRLADGHAVIAATGLAPGPLVGVIMQAIEEAAAVGDIRTSDEALALAKRLADADRGTG